MCSLRRPCSPLGFPCNPCKARLQDCREGNSSSNQDWLALMTASLCGRSGSTCWHAPAACSNATPQLVKLGVPLEAALTGTVQRGRRASTGRAAHLATGLIRLGVHTQRALPV